MSDATAPREGFALVRNTTLFYREIGTGQPIVLLHGGPDFDHSYLLPDMDRLASEYQLIYYDQRGRGKSAPETRAEDVTLATEIEDLDALRAHLGLETVAVLGHSWGGILAMEYAIRHPERVSHLILMNSAPAAHTDWVYLRSALRERFGPAQAELDALKRSPAYAAGDPDAVAAYYRIWFGATVKRPHHLDALMRQMRESFTSEGVLRARQIEEKLYQETAHSTSFNLLPKLQWLRIPTLVLHCDYDFIPVEIAAHIAFAIPGARFTLLTDCGHFSFLESPDLVRETLRGFFLDAASKVI